MSDVSPPAVSSAAASQPDGEVNLTDPAVYLPEPTNPCDVGMRGGITSGIVYPKAICEIARSFRFKNVGGTSAGAIAAASTAAAELGRRRRAPEGGFAEVAKLPQWLGADDHLFQLFQPESATEPLFRILVALSDQRKGGKLTARGAAVAGFKRWAAAGALPGVAALGGAAASRAALSTRRPFVRLPARSGSRTSAGRRPAPSRRPPRRRPSSAAGGARPRGA
jgi:hypothetical protein